MSRGSSRELARLSSAPGAVCLQTQCAGHWSDMALGDLEKYTECGNTRRLTCPQRYCDSLPNVIYKYSPHDILILHFFTFKQHGALPTPIYPAAVKPVSTLYQALYQTRYQKFTLGLVLVEWERTVDSCMLRSARGVLLMRF